MSGVRVTVDDLIARLMDFPADTLVVIERRSGTCGSVRVCEMRDDDGRLVLLLCVGPGE